MLLRLWLTWSELDIEKLLFGFLTPTPQQSLTTGLSRQQTLEFPEYNHFLHSFFNVSPTSDTNTVHAMSSRERPCNFHLCFLGIYVPLFTVPLVLRGRARQMDGLCRWFIAQIRPTVELKCSSIQPWYVIHGALFMCFICIILCRFGGHLTIAIVTAWQYESLGFVVLLYDALHHVTTVPIYLSVWSYRFSHGVKCCLS